MDVGAPAVDHYMRAQSGHTIDDARYNSIYDKRQLKVLMDEFDLKEAISTVELGIREIMLSRIVGSYQL